MINWSEIVVPGLTIHKHGEVELRNLKVAAPGRDEVLIRTEYSGVSVGTEMAGAYGRNLLWGEPPFTPGYQSIGRIVQFGEMTAPHNFKIGDLVACFTGKGTHRSLTVASVARTHRVHETKLSKFAGLYVQPCVAANALNKSRIKSGDNVLVIGQGLIGQATAILARMRGAHVVATDVSKERLSIAREVCAHEVLDTSQRPCSEIVLEKFPNGFDVVVESTGILSLVEEALKSVRFEGMVVFEGHYAGEIKFEFNLAHRKQIDAVFPFFIGEPKVRESVIDMITAGDLPMQQLVSHDISWREASNIYSKLFGSERDSLNGILIDWRDSLDGIVD
jgi:2-desacetyl-2-hydroxyethyl bacteriochlorophyllide A dehydrogenase